MQVADTTVASSATIGAVAAPKAVSITTDMSLVMMLTTNLYSNQLLAAIREPICNAWDANIEAGNTDVPLIIKYTKDGDLMIQDSGLGIPADKMDDIYGVYGQSTKKNNDAVTGGFGLGSKAPWALADSFRVISENNGIKTIYNMPKSCVENDGLPGILPVANMPTTRSGLTLLIPIPEEDVEEALLYVRFIVMHGGIKATFENEYLNELPVPLPVMEMSHEPGSYDINSGLWYNKYMGNHQIFIRYGAVVYPILQNPKTKPVIDVLEELMDMVGYRRMVIQAAPGSLALTPSREALSSHKMTEDGLVDLLTTLVKRIEEDIIEQIPGSIKQAIADLESGEYAENHNCTLTSKQDPIEVIKPYAVRKYLRSNLGSGFLVKYHRFLIHAEHRGFKAKHKFCNETATKTLHQMRKTFVSTSCKRGRRDACFSFFNRYVMRTLGKVFMNTPGMHPRNLRLSGQNYWNDRQVWNKNFFEGTGNFSDFGKQRQLIDNPIVFLTTRLSNVAETIQCCPSIGNGDLVWVYRADPRSKELEIFEKAFSDAGFTVFNLSKNYAWDVPTQRVMLDRKTRAKKPKAEKIQVKNNLAALVNFYHPTGRRKMSQGEAILLENPDYVTDTPLFYIEQDEFSERRVGKFTYYIDLTEDERNFGVLVRNGTEKRMAEHRGAVPADLYFANHLIAVLKTAAYRRYVTKQRQKSISEICGVESSQLELFQKLGISLPGLDKLKHDPKLERAYEMAQAYPHTLLSYINDDAETAKVQEIIDLKFEAPAFLKKLETVKEDPILRQLNTRNNGLLYWLDQYPERISALKSLVLSALKNGNKS